MLNVLSVSGLKCREYQVHSMKNGVRFKINERTAQGLRPVKAVQVASTVKS